MVIKRMKFGSWFYLNEDKEISYVFVESGFDNVYHMISESPEGEIKYEQVSEEYILENFGELE